MAIVGKKKRKKEGKKGRVLGGRGASFGGLAKGKEGLGGKKVKKRRETEEARITKDLC